MESYWLVHREIEMGNTSNKKIEEILKTEAILRITPEAESMHYCTNRSRASKFMGVTTSMLNNAMLKKNPMIVRRVRGVKIFYLESLK